MSACPNTLLIGADDVQDWAWIVDANGLLSDGPAGGEVVPLDLTDGGMWRPQARPPYSFDVPVLMISTQQDVALGQLRHLQGYLGQPATLTRKIIVDGATVQETCTGVLASAVQVQWDLERRSQVRATLIFTNLSGGWSPL